MEYVLALAGNLAKSSVRGETLEACANNLWPISSRIAEILDTTDSCHNNGRSVQTRRPWRLGAFPRFPYGNNLDGCSAGIKMKKKYRLWKHNE